MYNVDTTNCVIKKTIKEKRHTAQSWLTCTIHNLLFAPSPTEIQPLLKDERSSPKLSWSNFRCSNCFLSSVNENLQLVLSLSVLISVSSLRIVLFVPWLVGRWHLLRSSNFSNWAEEASCSHHSEKKMWLLVFAFEVDGQGQHWNALQHRTEMICRLYTAQSLPCFVVDNIRQT